MAAITEIPAKLIERTEALTEAKLKTALDLTAIRCSNAKEPLKEEEILKIYFTFYHGMKDLLPPPLEKVAKKKIFRPILVGVIVATLLGGALFFSQLISFFYK